MSKQLEEDVAEFLYRYKFPDAAENFTLKEWVNSDKALSKQFYDKAAQLIEKLRLVQLSEDQSLPENPYGKPNVFVEIQRRGAYQKAQQDMLNDGWVKRVKK